MISADELLAQIVNLNQCSDGLYSVETTNIRIDWETGYADDWDLKLMAFDPNAMHVSSNSPRLTNNSIT